MKFKSILITMTIGTASLFAGHVFAQNNNELTGAERDRRDSVEMANNRAEQLQTTRMKTGCLMPRWTESRQKQKRKKPNE
jgi:hypothetical protein